MSESRGGVAGLRRERPALTPPSNANLIGQPHPEDGACGLILHPTADEPSTKGEG